MFEKLVDSEFFRGFRAFTPNSKCPPTEATHGAIYCQGWESAQRNHLAYQEEVPESGSALSRLRPYGSHKE